MVGAGVLPHHENQLRVVDVVQRDGPLADADSRVQRRTRGFVAHVGAVRKIIGAQGPGEQLVHKRRLVGRAAGGVEDAAVRRAGPDVLTDQLEGFRPGDRRVVGFTFTDDHRLAEPALVAQPVLRLLRQLRDGVPGPELRPTVRRVFSSATALAPFSQNSATLRFLSDSGQAQPGQSMPPRWFSRSSDCPSGLPRPGPPHVPARPSRP